MEVTYRTYDRKFENSKMIRRCPACGMENQIEAPKYVTGAIDAYRLDNFDDLAAQLNVEKMFKLHKWLRDKTWDCVMCHARYNLGGVVSETQVSRTQLAQRLFGRQEQ